MLEIGIFAYWRKEYMCVEDRNICILEKGIYACILKKGISVCILKNGIYVC